MADFVINAYDNYDFSSVIGYFPVVFHRNFLAGFHCFQVWHMDLRYTAHSEVSWKVSTTDWHR